jgi:predicted oxidoreductase
MNKRPLGRAGLQIAPLVLGENVFGWTVDQPTSFSLLDRFVDAGLNAIDTADMYSTWAPGNKGGESETIINGPRCDISAVVHRCVCAEERKDGHLAGRRAARGG